MRNSVNTMDKPMVAVANVRQTNTKLSQTEEIRRACLAHVAPTQQYKAPHYTRSAIDYNHIAALVSEMEARIAHKA